MEGEAEAVHDALTGALSATTVEGDSGVQSALPPPASPCLNCGAALAGAYCAACGQKAHLHRSLLSLGHDILHGVFHFEGKIWRTVPELSLHPGRLTRRYIDGERTKFVSPMALFLFTVFLMFAVFSVTGDALIKDNEIATIGLRVDNTSQLELTDRRVKDLREQLAASNLTQEARARIARQIEELLAARVVMDALNRGDLPALADIENREAAVAEQSTPTPPEQTTFERKLREGVKQVNENPSLLLYKLKANGYKFSWVLVPLSAPFLWLLFFWRRDIHLYDHAVFATYSICFMMLLLIIASLAAAAGVGTGIWASVLIFVPPVHVYRQLRGAYGLSRIGSLVRLLLLFVVATVVLTLFTLLLLVMGLLG